MVRMRKNVYKVTAELNRKEYQALEFICYALRISKRDAVRLAIKNFALKVKNELMKTMEGGEVGETEISEKEEESSPPEEISI